MEASDQPRPRDPVMEANIRMLNATRKRTTRDAQALKSQLLIHMQKRNAIYQQMCMWMEMSRHQLIPDPVNFPYALAQQQQRGAMLQQLQDATTCCKSFDGKLLQRELYKNKRVFDAKLAKSNSLLENELKDILLKNDTASSSTPAVEELAVKEETTTQNSSCDVSDQPEEKLMTDRQAESALATQEHCPKAPSPEVVPNYETGSDCEHEGTEASTHSLHSLLEVSDETEKDEQQNEPASSIPLADCSAVTPTANLGHSLVSPTASAALKEKVSSIIKKLEVDSKTTSLPLPGLAVREPVQRKTTTNIPKIITMLKEAGSCPKTAQPSDVHIPKGTVSGIHEMLSQEVRAKPAATNSSDFTVIPKGKVSSLIKKSELDSKTTSVSPSGLATREAVQRKTTTVPKIIARFEAGSCPKIVQPSDVHISKGRVSNTREMLLQKVCAKPAAKSFVVQKGKVFLTAKKFEVNIETVIAGTSSSTCKPTAILKGKVATIARMFENSTTCTPTELESRSSRVVKTVPSISPPKMIAVLEKAQEDNATRSMTLESAATTATQTDYTPKPQTSQVCNKGSTSHDACAAPAAARKKKRKKNKKQRK